MAEPTPSLPTVDELMTLAEKVAANWSLRGPVPDEIAAKDKLRSSLSLLLERLRDSEAEVARLTMRDENWSAVIADELHLNLEMMTALGVTAERLEREGGHSFGMQMARIAELKATEAEAEALRSRLREVTEERDQARALAKRHRDTVTMHGRDIVGDDFPDVELPWEVSPAPTKEGQ